MDYVKQPIQPVTQKFKLIDYGGNGGSTMHISHIPLIGSSLGLQMGSIYGVWGDKEAL